MHLVPKTNYSVHLDSALGHSSGWSSVGLRVGFDGLCGSHPAQHNLRFYCF